MELTDNSVIYSWFEISLDQIFHELWGSTTLMPHEQSYWKEIQGLKDLAIKDVFSMYRKAEFDTLRVFGTDKWCAGFFCQGPESQTNDGLICYAPLQKNPKHIREGYLSPVCATPREAIEQAYELHRKWINSTSLTDC